MCRDVHSRRNSGCDYIHIWRYCRLKTTHSLILLALVFSGAVLAEDADRIALQNAALFDSVIDRVQTGKTVLVNGRIIDAIIDADQPIPAGYRVIDCEGNTLMPGLLDAHTHFNSLEQSGMIEGPDIVAGGVYVTPDLGDAILADPRLASLADGVNSDEDLRLVVRVNIDRGVDVIKTRGTERAGLAQTDPRQQVYSQHQLAVVVDICGQRPTGFPL